MQDAQWAEEGPFRFLLDYSGFGTNLGPGDLSRGAGFIAPSAQPARPQPFPRAEAASYPTSARPGADGHLAEPSECVPVQLGMFGWSRSSHFDSAWSGCVGQFRERANGPVTAFLNVELLAAMYEQFKGQAR